MTHLCYVLGAWGLVLGTGALYAAYLMRRGRKLASRVPAGRRRWMSAPDR